MKLSIVIPIYNVEDYIPRCFDSILKQNTPLVDFELVCVIDGSPDNSVEVVRKYKEHFSNIRIIEQNNMGVSAARNQAIRESTGKYVTFVDPDDILVDGSLSQVLDYIKTTEDDEIVVYRSYSNDKEKYPWSTLFHDGSLIDPKILLERGYMRGSVWGAMYKRTFLITNNILFPEGVRNCEDTFFFLMCMYYCSKIRFKDVRLYKVVGMEGSASRSLDKKRLEIMINSVERVNNIINKLPVKADRLFIIQYMKYSILSNLIYFTIKTEGVGYRLIRNAQLQQYADFIFDNNVVFNRGKMRLMNLSISLFYLVAWLRHKVL